MNWLAIASFLADAQERPMFVADAGGVVRLCNCAFERVVGRPRSEIIGHPWQRSIDAGAVEVHPVRDGLVGFAAAADDDFARILRDRLAAVAARHQLSDREREVLDHLVRGRTVEEIGAALGISPRTAKFHQANVLAKLGIASRVELISSLLER